MYSNAAGVDEGFYIDDVQIINITDDGVAAFPGVFLGYHDGYTENSWAYTGGENWEAAIQLTDTLLAAYRDYEITEVKFSCGCDDYGFEVADYEIWISDVLEDPTAPPVVYGTGTSSGTGWDTVTLDMPYEIPDTGDVYLGITYSNYGVGVAWPAGVDTTNYVPEGFWFYYSGVWQDGSGLLGPSVWGLSAGVSQGGTPAVPDLDCSGMLDFVDVEPNGTVTGTITVENVGEVDSLLDWEIESFPDWGTWTFTPDSGTDLLAGDTVDIAVEIIAPDEPETEFSGEVVIVNSEDPDDICIVQVTLVTPVSQQSLFAQFFDILAQRFPILARVLALIF
jgi:hypothetical protein